MNRLASLALLACLALPAAVLAQPAVPTLISYHGRVADSSGALIGAGSPVNRTVTFRVYRHKSNSGADRLWSESQTVTIANGEFSVLLGAGTAVPGEPNHASATTFDLVFNSASITGSADRYLGVTVDDGTAAADTEITPRQQIVTSAFALRAKVAEGLSGSITFSQLTGSLAAAQISGSSITSDKVATTFFDGFRGSAPTFTNSIRVDNTLNINAGGNSDTTITARATVGQAYLLNVMDAGGTQKLLFTNTGNMTLTGNLSVSGNVSVSGNITGSVNGSQIVDGSISGGKIGGGEVGYGKIAHNSVDSAIIIDGNVNTADLANNAVTSDKIAAGAITANKLAAGVGSSHTSTVTVSADRIGNNVAIGDAENYSEHLVLKWNTPTPSGTHAGKERLLALGYIVPSSDPNDSGYGVIQGHHRAAVWTPLKLNPNGGAVEVGAGGLGVIGSVLTRGNIQILSGSTVVFNAGTNGNLAISGSVTQGTSDRRVKKNILPLTGSLEKLLRLNSVTFEYIDQTKNTPGVHAGFIAQEVEPLFPQWVFTNEDGIKSIGYRGFESLAVQALRELRAEKDEQLQQRDTTIAALEKNVAAMKAESDATKARLAALERLVAKFTAAGSN